jgi:hypothetical protein
LELTTQCRKQHIRKTNRYQTEVIDKKWGVIEPHLPAPDGSTTGLADAQDYHGKASSM